MALARGNKRPAAIAAGAETYLATSLQVCGEGCTARFATGFGPAPGQSAAQQSMQSLKLAACGVSCAHFDRVVMLDELFSNRRQCCVSATTSAPTLSDNGWFAQELIYLLHS
jgi:hypothetical protein